jgi:two-component system, OmpR family, sensor histidine kinase BaeS
MVRLLSRSLTAKLTLAFLLVALTVAALVAVFIRLTSATQLDRLIVEQQRSAFRDTLVAYYETNGSWNGVWQAVKHNQEYPEGTSQPGGGHGGYGQGPHAGYRPDRGDLFGLVDTKGRVVIPLWPDYPPNAYLNTAAVIEDGDPLEVNGEVVGVIVTAELPPGLTPEEAAYLQRTNTALLLAGGGAVLVALLVGVLLARTLTSPLHSLTLATHRMAVGDLEQVVPVKSADEIGALAAAFNQMSRAVARANTARRQMTADVAHELRSPLTVIAGYIEAMRDGVLAPTPERLSVIYGEMEHLQHLVGDLRLLSQADAGELKLNQQPLAPRELLEQTSAAFAHQAAQKGVRLELLVTGDPPKVRADETRLAQVLDNLLSNALRYTPLGGRIVLGAEAAHGRVAFTVQDTGPGIAPEALPFVFDRFYRADASRSADTGESGLGLAIAKAIVEAHGGSLRVSSVVGEGTGFSIELPAA